MSLTIARPANSEYAAAYSGYVGAVPDGDVIDLLERQGAETAAALRRVGEERSRYRYASGKWSIREVVGHVTDSERVFTYRALRFARGDANPLPGFDENAWGAATNADSRSLASLVDEFEAVRRASVALFRGFPESYFARGGTASGHEVTVRALVYITAGHERHHMRILRERYGL